MKLRGNEGHATLFRLHDWWRSTRRLLECYGQPQERVVWDPLKQFIYSLPWSRTRAYVTYEIVEGLEMRFGTSRICADAQDPVSLDDHHRLIKIHGQRTCTPNHPGSSACPLDRSLPDGTAATWSADSIMIRPILFHDWG